MSSNKIKTGDVFQTNEGGSVIVVEYRSYRAILVEHNDKHACQAVVQGGALRKGHIKNPYRKSILGVGINDSDYSTTISRKINGKKILVWKCPFYGKWLAMLSRCYSEKTLVRQKSYRGCKVCPEWHKFSVFREWMEAQDWQGKQIDKDIIAPGNKTYSPNTCAFVDRAVNMFLVNSSDAVGRHPLGVTWNKPRNKFLAQCNNPFNGKVEYLGHFDDPAKAHEAWRRRKHELACTHADEQKDLRVARVLRERFSENIYAA